MDADLCGFGKDNCLMCFTPSGRNDEFNFHSTFVIKQKILFLGQQLELDQHSKHTV